MLSSNQSLIPIDPLQFHSQFLSWAFNSSAPRAGSLSTALKPQYLSVQHLTSSHYRIPPNLPPSLSWILPCWPYYNPLTASLHFSTFILSALFTHYCAQFPNTWANFPPSHLSVETQLLVVREWRRGEYGGTANGYGFLFLDDENVLKLDSVQLYISVNVQHYEYTQNHLVMYFKIVSLRVCELYLNFFLIHEEDCPLWMSTHFKYVAVVWLYSSVVTWKIVACFQCLHYKSKWIKFS